MKKYAISSAFLKHVAYLSMLIDHFFVVVFAAYRGWLEMQGNLTDTVNDIYDLGRHVGRIAFILFAFMASEGFRYTHSRKRYLLRLFSFALPFLCMSGAAGVWLLVREYGQWKKTAYALVTLVSFLTALYYLNGNNGEPVLIMQAELIDSGQIAHGEYLYEGTEINRLPERAGRVAVQKREDGSEKEIVISDYEKEGGNLSFHYQMKEPEAVYVELPLLYYPGYGAWIDGQRVEVVRGEQNVLRLWLQPDTEGTVLVRYTGLGSWNAATWISLVTLAAVMAYYGVKYWKTYKKRT